jgi:biotin carboxylase
VSSSDRPQIALVLGIGGPGLDYALPRLRRRGDVHVLCLVQPSPFNQRQIDRYCTTSVTEPIGASVPHTELVARITRFAVDRGADAVLTFSEFAVHAVAGACDQLSLRGAGPNTMRSRDKWSMRCCWERAGVPVPRFARVDGLDDLQAAYHKLDTPFLLKPALSAGSIGQQVIASAEELPAAYERCRGALSAAALAGGGEYGGSAQRHLVAEDIIRSSSAWWFDDPRYGDYVSVEGIVAGGIYHPICITARLPTIAPFTELSNQAPCVLPADKQRLVEATARSAVEALELDTCATHTEIKLLPDGDLCLIESAARLPGAMVVREVEEVYAVDMIGALVDALLGEPHELPQSMLVAGTGRAAASLALIATDSTGRPWERLPVFDPQRIAWKNLVGSGTSVEVVEAQTLPPGTRMPRYDATGGVLSFGGLLFVIAPDAATLLDDTISILDGLESELARTDEAHASLDC